MTGRKKSTKKLKRETTPQHRRQAVPQTNDDSTTSEAIPANIKKEAPPPIQTVKKIIKTENDEARTLKVVFKSNPDTQMKDFIKKGSKPAPVSTKVTLKTPAETHPPAVVEELLETDDEVADNLTKLFKTSKSYKTN